MKKPPTKTKKKRPSQPTKKRPRPSAAKARNRGESRPSWRASRPPGPPGAGGKVRILVGKVGLDGHDRGVKVIARALRDAGYEVIYTGLHQTPEMVVNTAIQEDVRAIGLSILSGAHMTLFPRVIELLRERGASDIVVFGGGIIPDEDVSTLKKAGVRELFTPGTSTRDVIAFVRRVVEGVRE